MPESTEDSSQVVREQSESVAATNLKVLGDGPAFHTNQAYAASNDAAAGYRTMNQAIIGKMAENIVNTSPSEGSNAITMAAVMAKVMQTTPPLTAGQNVANQG